MSNLGDPASLRSAMVSNGSPAEGMAHHLAVSSTQGDFGSSLYTAHQQPQQQQQQPQQQQHHPQQQILQNSIHGGQFIYGNGDLARQQAQFSSSDLYNWQAQQLQQQQQQQHQLPTQNYQQQQQPPQQFQPATALPEHHGHGNSFPQVQQQQQQQFANPLGHQQQQNPAQNLWSVGLGDTSSGFPQQPQQQQSPQQQQQHPATTVSPPQISSAFANGNIPSSNDRSLSAPAQPERSLQVVDISANPHNQMATTATTTTTTTTFTMLEGVPHVSIHYIDEYPDALAALENLGYLEPTQNKKARISTSSAPSPAAAAAAPSPAPAPAPAKAASKPAAPPPPPPPPKSKVPTEPLAKLRYLLQECLDTDDDDEEAREIASKTWGIIADVNPDQPELVAVAVGLILKIADDETLKYMGKIMQFTVKLRKWIVYEHNKDKKSPMIPKMLKLLSQIRLELDMYERGQWEKVLHNIQRKSELDKSREFAQSIMTRFNHLRKEEARKEQAKRAATNTNAADKQRSFGGGVVKKDSSSSTLNAGVKRTIDEATGRGTTTTSASKKISLGDVRNPIPNPNAPKAAAPSSAPQRIGGDKKSVGTSTVGSQGPNATKPKPSASSGFFKTLGKSAEPAKAQSKVSEKKATQPAPPADAVSFTSIFAQLQQRQKDQDREKRDAATKAADAAKTIEDEKQKKKKKSVKWKTGDDLVKVQIIEWLEPEGEYYGGGSGLAEWEDSSGEGQALKNKNFVEEEEDLMEWYQPQPVNFDSLHKRKPELKEHPEKRGGNTVVETEESKAQKQRELVTLAAFYSSTRDIPASPMEPEETPDDGKQPTEIPLPDSVKLRLGFPIVPPPAPAVPTAPLPPTTTDLSSLLSAMQQPNMLGMFAPPPQVPQPQVPQPQPQPPQQFDLTAILSMIGAATQQPQQPNFLQGFLQPQQQQQQQSPQNPNAAVADILSKLTSGAANTAATGATPVPFQMPAFPGLFPTPQQQQQTVPPSPPTAPRAWNGEQQHQQQAQPNQQPQQPQQPEQQQTQQQTQQQRDVRRELRDAVGWSDTEVKGEVAGTGANGNGGGGGGGGGGGKWSKHSKKKDKKAKQAAEQKASVLCLFFQKGNCKHGDSCRFSHDLSLPPGTPTSADILGQQQRGKGGKKKHHHHGHHSRGVDQGATGNAVGWPSVGELEY